MADTVRLSALYAEIAEKALVGAAGHFSTIAGKKFLNGSNM
jgi:hypothetical protein